METKVTVRKEGFAEFTLKGNVAIVTFAPEPLTEGYCLASQLSVKLNRKMSYDEVVARLIHARYTSDGEVALINNALSDIANIADNAEYAEYQRWRNKCKETAKNYLGL